MAAVAREAKKIDGKMPSLFTVLPRLPYGIKEIPPALAAGTTTAYYHGGPPRRGLGRRAGPPRRAGGHQGNPAGRRGGHDRRLLQWRLAGAGDRRLLFRQHIEAR